MRALLPLLTAAVLSAAPAAAQSVAFTSSDLPIVLVDTDGVEIPDDPKIPALMAVIDNGPGVRNHVSDPPTDYDGHIGIEIRGTSSQMFPKKQYGLETRDADGDSRNVSIFGMPSENDWILYAPYSDKALMRNVVAYELAWRTGRYASRTRFCELVLNGEYQGVYVFMEKIKQDNNRVDVSGLDPDETSGDDLTGGYILQIDRHEPDAGWFSPFGSAEPGAQRAFFAYDDPDADDLVPVQKAYIRGFVTAFEEAMAADTYADPELGYPAYVDVGSFVDFILINELAKNIDAYRLSTFLHKDKDSNDPLLHAGPVWDFNIAFGNADYHDGADTAGFQFDAVLPPWEFPIQFWWPRLAHEAGFRDTLSARWAALREGPLHPDSLDALVDRLAAEVDEAQARNFERWPVLGTYVWPNAYIGETYEDEVNYFRGWLAERAAWLDGTLTVSTAPPPPHGTALALSAPAPNPSRGDARLSVTLARPGPAVVDVFDALGRRVARLHGGPLAEEGPFEVQIEGLRLPPGTYFVRATAAGETVSRAFTVLR